MRWLRWLTFFIGWLLSPLTPWNDAFLNLPLAYVAASLVNRVLPNSFPVVFLASYWLTNLAGILLVLWSGHRLLKERPLQVHATRRLWVWMVLFSLLILFLIWRGWVRPF
jgi:hypothetical protein